MHWKSSLVGVTVGVSVGVLVGVNVIVAVGKTKEVKVGKGVEEGRRTISGVALFSTIMKVGVEIVGSWRRVAVEVGRIKTSGISLGCKGLMED